MSVWRAVSWRHPFLCQRPPGEVVTLTTTKILTNVIVLQILIPENNKIPMALPLGPQIMWHCLSPFTSIATELLYGTQLGMNVFFYFKVISQTCERQRCQEESQKALLTLLMEVKPPLSFVSLHGALIVIRVNQDHLHSVIQFALRRAELDIMIVSIVHVTTRIQMIVMTENSPTLLLRHRTKEDPALKGNLALKLNPGTISEQFFNFVSARLLDNIQYNFLGGYIFADGQNVGYFLLMDRI